MNAIAIGPIENLQAKSSGLLEKLEALSFF
jgi:hypothetical protein